MIKLVMYNDTMWSFIRMPDSSFYIRNKKRRKNFSSPDEVQRVSLSRTKNRIREICLSNSFQYFCTMTVSSSSCDRFSLQEVQDKMKKICKKIRRKNKDFKYIYITEEHKKGAFHFHGMVKNIELYKNKNGYLSSKEFDELGFNSFSKIKSYNACCNYITKYITKNCIKNENNQIYFCSRGLKSADVDDLVDYDLQDIFTNTKVFQNEYCQKHDFDLSKLSKTHIRNLNGFFKYNDELFQNCNNNVTNRFNLFTNFKINVIN